MDPELQAALERAAKQAIVYRRTVDEPAPPPCTYKEALALFDARTPEAGQPAPLVLDELIAQATPGLRSMTNPRFFGWVIGASHPMGVAADWLTSAWGQNAGNHFASPAAAAAETVAARWLLDLLDLPPEASIGFVTGGTAANHVCLAAARGSVLRRAGWDVEADGLFGAPSIHVLIGDDAHTTAFSALQYLGLGHGRVIRVPTDDQGRMLPTAFEAALARLPAGPIIAIIQAGQINTGGFDPAPVIIPAAHARGAWVHADGAFGLWARACPGLAHLAEGLEDADSWAVDGHKWLQTPYDCGYAIVRDAEAHRSAMTISASYLPPVAEGERDPSHYVPELSRRARGFATWAMIRHLGRAGIADMIERHCRLTRWMAEQLGAESGIHVLNDVVLNQMVLRFGSAEPGEEADMLTTDTIARIQADGMLFAGGARWRDRWVMRLSVIAGPMTDADADLTCETIRTAWRMARGRHRAAQQ